MDCAASYATLGKAVRIEAVSVGLVTAERRGKKKATRKSPFLQNYNLT